MPFGSSAAVWSHSWVCRCLSYCPVFVTLHSCCSAFPVRVVSRDVGSPLMLMLMLMLMLFQSGRCLRLPAEGRGWRTGFRRRAALGVGLGAADGPAARLLRPSFLTGRAPASGGPVVSGPPLLALVWW